MTDHPLKPLVAEGIGTFALCFVGIFAIAGGNIIGNAGVTSLTGIALAHGLAIFVMVAALGAVSGAHFNPAVTFGFVVTGRMTPVRGAMYVGAQLLGGVVAGLVASIFGAVYVADGTPQVHTAITLPGAAVLEAVATFFLVFVVFGTAVDERAPKGVFPLAIGMTVALDILAFGPLTGAAMNPARAFGPALVGGAWDGQWVYWVGPLLGGALGAWAQHGLLMRRAPSAATAERGGPAPREERGA
jgi:aquaporin TIP